MINPATGKEYGDDDPDNTNPVGQAIGQQVGQALNSQQQWNAQAAGMPEQPVVGMRRPSVHDYGTETQVARGARIEAGFPEIGAPPGTDIRSKADQGRDPMSGLSSEAAWRSIFGAKKTPDEVSPAATPLSAGVSKAMENPSTLGMNSVMMAHSFAHNLLQSIGAVVSDRSVFDPRTGAVDRQHSDGEGGYTMTPSVGESNQIQSRYGTRDKEGWYSGPTGSVRMLPSSAPASINGVTVN